MGPGAGVGVFLGSLGQGQERGGACSGCRGTCIGVTPSHTWGNHIGVMLTLEGPTGVTLSHTWGGLTLG